jgi:hypothetical protein
MGKKNMMGMMGMGMSMMNAPMMSSPMMSQRMMSQRMMGLMKIQEDKKPSLMMALKDALADGKLTMMERMELKKQYPMAEASGKLDMQVMMALEKINKVQSPVVMARPMKPSLMKAIKEALSDGKLTMMERMELKMQFPMAAESGKLDNKIMMIAEKKELMGVLMDTEKSDTPIMMMMMREISEGTKILQSKEGTEADRKFAATNAFRKKVGLPPITREKFEADAAADAERKARRAMRTMMQNMGIKMAIKDALADGKLTMMEKMELKKEFPKAAKSGQLDKKIMMVQMMLEPIKMDAKPVPMMATGIMMAIKDALADGKLTMMEKMELKMQFPLAAESGKLEKKVMMALKKINEVQQPAKKAKPMKPAKKAKPMKPSLMKAIEKALDDGKLTMMELKKLEMMYPMAAESGKLDQKIMMAQMMLDPIKDKKAVEPNPPMMKMGLNMAIKDALADGKLTMMEKMELKMQFPMAAESGKLDEKIMMVQMMLDPIKDKKAVEPNPPMMKMGLNMAIKDALSDGKLTMMEKMELKMQFPMAAESGKLDEKIMMAQMMLDSIKMDAVKSEVKKESEPASPMMKMGLNMAIKDALSDGKLTMMEKMELKMQFPMAAESGKLDEKIMMAQMMLDPIKDKKAVEPNPPMMMMMMGMGMGLNMAIKDALSDGKLTMMEKMELKMQFPMAAESGKLDEKIVMAQMMLDPIKDKKAVEPASPMMMMMGMGMGLNMAIKDALSDGKLTMMEKMELKMQFPMAAESGKLDQKIDKFTDKTSMDLKTDTSDSKDNNQTVKDADSSDSSENKGKDKDGKDKIIDGKDRGGGKIIFDGRIDSGVNKGDKGPHHGLPKIDYDASIDNYKPERLDFVKKDGTFKKPKLKRKDYSADTFRSEAFKSELDSRGLTGDRRGGTVTHFKDSTGTLKKIPTDASGIPKALTSDGKGGFKDLGGPPTLSTERDLFGDLDETRQSKLATIKSIVDNPQPGATKMAISMRKSKGLSILMDAGFTQTRTRMKPLLMTPASNSRSTRLNIRL